MMIHPEALKRLAETKINADGLTQIFQHIASGVALMGAEASQTVLDYEGIDDAKLPGSLIPVIILAVRPQQQEAPSNDNEGHQP